MVFSALGSRTRSEVCGASRSLQMPEVYRAIRVAAASAAVYDLP